MSGTTRKSMRRLVSQCMFIGVLWLGTGCVSTTSSSQQVTAMPSLQTATLLKFPDVPVPVGFQLVDNESFAFQNTMMRVGLLKYTGRPTIDRVVQFYREQMPLHQWVLLNLLEYEARILNFDKADETCIITIGKRGDRTQVTIAVAPKGGAAKAMRKAPGSSNQP